MPTLGVERAEHIDVLFAVMGGSSQSLCTDCVVMAPFLIAASIGFKRTQWLVVVGLAAYGVIDLVHPHLLSNPGVPVWWPSFCLAYDLVAADYLTLLLIGPWSRPLSSAGLPHAGEERDQPGSEDRCPRSSPSSTQSRASTSAAGENPNQPGSVPPRTRLRCA